jgi:hypothetical protein
MEGPNHYSDTSNSLDHFGTAYLNQQMLTAYPSKKHLGLNTLSEFPPNMLDREWELQLP